MVIYFIVNFVLLYCFYSKPKGNYFAITVLYFYQIDSRLDSKFRQQKKKRKALQKNSSQDITKKLVNSIVEALNNSYSEEPDEEAENMVQYTNAKNVIKKYEKHFKNARAEHD